MDINRKQRNDVLEPGDIQCIGHNTDVSDSRVLYTAFSDILEGLHYLTHLRIRMRRTCLQLTVSEKMVKVRRCREGIS